MLHGMGTVLTDWRFVPLAGNSSSHRAVFDVIFAATSKTTTTATMTTTTTTTTITTTTTRTPLLARLLEGLQSERGFVLPCNVPSDRVVPRERPLAERARHSDPLVTLPYVGSQVRLVAVQLLAVRTL